MTPKELREKGVGELTRLIQEEQHRLQELRFKVSRDEHKDVRDLRESKKLIARMLTILQQKQAKST